MSLDRDDRDQPARPPYGGGSLRRPAAERAERACADITAVCAAQARLAGDARGLLGRVLDGSVAPAAADRALTEMARALAGHVHRSSALVTGLGAGPEAGAQRALADAHAAAVADYLGLAAQAVRRAPAAGTVIPDAPGVSLKPDPLAAATPAELNDALRAYHAWAGAPSLGQMSHRCGGTPVKTTFRNLLRADRRLPKLPMVAALVTGCGGTEEDRQLFASAWRAVRAAQDDARRQYRHLRTA
jgi:hypothetical protein